MEARLSTALVIAERLDDLEILEEDEIHHYSLTYGRKEVGKITPHPDQNGNLKDLSRDRIKVHYDVDLSLLSSLKEREFERQY